MLSYISVSQFGVLYHGIRGLNIEGKRPKITVGYDWVSSTAARPSPGRKPTAWSDTA